MELELKYDAALRAARESVWWAVEACIADGHTHMASHCASESIAAYEALAKAVGAFEHANAAYLGLMSLHEAYHRAKAEADRLAAPFLSETEESMHSKREAR